MTVRDPSGYLSIVMLTPDDVGYSRHEGAESARRRAGQLVTLEMGMVLASLGRQNRVVLRKQHPEHPSEDSGFRYLNFIDHVSETLPQLVQRLQQAGFEITGKQLTHAATP